MIYSNKYKFICFNPPKTATGFREILLAKPELEAFCSKNFEIQKGVWEEGVHFHNKRHLTFLETKYWFKINNLNFKKYYKITFVRNPWHRILSWMNMHLQDSGNRINFINYWSYQFKYIQPTLQQKNYYLDENNNIGVDYIGTFENLYTDLNFFIKKNNLPIIKLPPKNKKYKSYDIEELIKLIPKEMRELISKLEYDTILLKNYRI